VRKCATERKYLSCAECTEYPECRKLNNFVSKMFAIVFRSNRKGNLQEIQKMGIEKWAEERAASGKK